MSVNVKLKDEIGQFRVYEDVDTITVNTDEEGVLATFYLDHGFDTPEERHNKIVRLKQKVGSNYYKSITWYDSSNIQYELICFWLNGIGTWLVTPTNALCLSNTYYFQSYLETDYVIFLYGGTNANYTGYGVSFSNDPKIFYKQTGVFQDLTYTYTYSGTTYTARPNTITKIGDYIFAYFPYSPSADVYIAVYNLQGVKITHWYEAEEYYNSNPTLNSLNFGFYSIQQVSSNVFIFVQGLSSSGNQSYRGLTVNLNNNTWHLSDTFSSYRYLFYRPLTNTLGILGQGYYASNYYSTQEYLFFVNRLTGEFIKTLNKDYWPSLYWSNYDSYGQDKWKFFVETNTYYILAGMHEMSNTNYTGYTQGRILKVDKTTFEITPFSTVACAMFSFCFDENTEQLFYTGYSDAKLHKLDMNSMTETTYNLYTNSYYNTIRKMSRGILVSSGYWEDSMGYYYQKRPVPYSTGIDYSYDPSYTIYYKNFPGSTNNRYNSSYDSAYGAYFYDLYTDTFHTIINKQGMFNVVSELNNCIVLTSSYGYNYSENYKGVYYFDELTHTIYNPSESIQYTNIQNQGYILHIKCGKYIIVSSGYSYWYNYNPSSNSGHGIFIIDTENFTYTYYENPVSGTNYRDTFYYWIVTPDNVLWFRPYNAVSVTRHNYVYRIKNGVMTSIDLYNSGYYTNIYWFYHFTFNNKNYIHLNGLYEYIDSDTLVPVTYVLNNNILNLMSSSNSRPTYKEDFEHWLPNDYYGRNRGSFTGGLEWYFSLIYQKNSTPKFTFIPFYGVPNNISSSYCFGLLDENNDFTLNNFSCYGLLRQVVYENNSRNIKFIVGSSNNYSSTGWLVFHTDTGNCSWIDYGGYNLTRPNTVARLTFEEVGNDLYIYEPALKDLIKWKYDFTNDTLTRITWEDMEQNQGQNVNLEGE